ncbi:MAG: AEC family transporter [Gammaproteobacteria bacterium]|nr:AEC family transporter [Gammaproteobacteria bacterium]
MLEVIAQMGVLIGAGIVLRLARPGGRDPELLRRGLADIVYYLLLPALVLGALWRTELGWDSVRIAWLAAAGVLAALWLAGVGCRVCRVEAPTRGALMLAAAFPNVTYLGLPVLEATFGPWARGVAIQYDLFACTPLLLTVGILTARKYGTVGDADAAGIGRALVQVPALWAALLAVVLNRSGVPAPVVVDSLLRLLGNAVAPLMLIALGLGLRWLGSEPRQLLRIVPVLAIQLVLMPLLVWGLALATGLDSRLLAPVVLEAAMPSMVLGMVICDRYGLDTSSYATAVTLSTVLSMLTLPLWYRILA